MQLMAKRATAAVLLFSVLVWAEMALAPMLAMHAGHMRASHEMAADMPAEHSAHHTQPQEEMNHPCCPPAHKQTSANTLEFTAGAPPCGDPHSCCFRQGPQSVPAPARQRAGYDELAKDLIPASQAVPIPANEWAKQGSWDSVPSVSPRAEVFGMTLRV